MGPTNNQRVLLSSHLLRARTWQTLRLLLSHRYRLPTSMHFPLTLTSSSTPWITHDSKQTRHEARSTAKRRPDKRLANGLDLIPRLVDYNQGQEHLSRCLVDQQRRSNRERCPQRLWRGAARISSDRTTRLCKPYENKVDKTLMGLLLHSTRGYKTLLLRIECRG